MRSLPASLAELIDDLALSIEKQQVGRAVGGDLQDEPPAAAAVHQRHAGDAFPVVSDDETSSIAGGLRLRQGQPDDVVRRVLYTRQLDKLRRAAVAIERQGTPASTISPLAFRRPPNTRPPFSVPSSL